MSLRSAHNWFAVTMAIGALALLASFTHGFGVQTARDRNQALRDAGEAARRAAAAAEQGAEDRRRLQEATDAATAALIQIDQAFYVFGPVNNGPGGMVTIDPGGDIVYATDGVERISGWSISEIMDEAGRLILMPESVRRRIEAHNALPMGKRMRFPAGSGVQLQTNDDRLLPVAVDVWRYEWEGNAWMAMSVIPDRDLILITDLGAPDAQIGGASMINTLDEGKP